MADSNVKKILLTVDGSEHSLEAVRYTAKSVPVDSVKVVLFHIRTRVPESFWDQQREPAFRYRYIDVGEWEDQQEAMIQEFMSRAGEILYAAGVPKESVKIGIQDRQAGIASDIIAESKRGYDTVVVSRRGLSEFKDFLLGSIANKLVEKAAHVPVWIVGSSQQRGKVLLAVDGSEGAMLAVDYVGNMLGTARNMVDITLFHVVRGFDFFHPMMGRTSGAVPDKALREKYDKELERVGREIEPVFEEATKRLMRAGVAPACVREKLIKGASTRSSAIADEAEKQGYDTIVVGRRGLSKVQEFFMGRVSNKVIQLAKDKTVWVVS
jgi:nucleotide-binding universal stress UspA family protein